jgi:hypothetical protein
MGAAFCKMEETPKDFPDTETPSFKLERRFLQ